MDTLSPLRKLYYTYLSTAYATTYKVQQHRFLGFRIGSWLVFILLMLLIAGWLRGWETVLMIAIALVFLWVTFSLWTARRANYMRFIPDNESIMSEANLEPLGPGQKVDLLASGRFAVSGRENVLLLQSGKYWRVPLGDQIVMVEERPGTYLYQFFNARSLQTIERGWLLFGREPRLSLAVSFLGRWGPEFTKFQLYDDGGDNGQPAKQSAIYLTFTTEKDRTAVWHTIVDEARQVRSDSSSD